MYDPLSIIYILIRLWYSALIQDRSLTSHHVKFIDPIADLCRVIPLAKWINLHFVITLCQ